MNVTVEELLTIIGRLYAENYALQRRIAELTPPPEPPTLPEMSH